MDNSTYAVGPIQVQGAVTVDFGLPGSLPLEQLPAVIERDRLHMAKRPGLRQKHLPFLVDAVSGNLLSGGRYLFDTVEHAEQYKAWAANEFVLDGLKFFERPFFINPVCYVWKVIGAQDLADIHDAHKLIRSERWQAPQESLPDLAESWSHIHNEAKRRGLASVWLLHNEPERLVGLISIAGKVQPTDQSPADDVGLETLAAAPSLGTMFEQHGWTKVFDRTSWVLTIWFPIAEGQPDVPALWPNSPPLPAPAYALAAG